MTELLLDHVVLAGPDLDQLVTEFRDRTGIDPKLGGRHPGGTRNYLVRLTDTAYLEIIGPDKLGPGIPLPTAFGINTLTAPRIATWLVHPVDIEQTIATALAGGYNPGPLGPLSRETPEGTVLRWRLTHDAPDNLGGLAPGLIDWFDTPHPTGSGLPQATLVDFRGHHPNPELVRKAHAVLGVTLDVEEGAEAGLTLEIDTPKGRVTLW
jgi:hypothetical protein